MGVSGGNIIVCRGLPLHIDVLLAHTADHSITYLARRVGHCDHNMVLQNYKLSNAFADNCLSLSFNY